MDDHRPGLNLKFYENICPDQNVPVIAVFTKYDQFLRNVKMDVSDDPAEYPDRSVSEVAEELFQEHYLRPLGDAVEYVRLEKMHVKGSQCGELIEKTAAALNEDAVVLMLLDVQKGNVELSVKMAWRQVHHLITSPASAVIQECLFAFPYIWWYKYLYLDSEYSRELLEPSYLLSRKDERLRPMTKQIMALYTIRNLIIQKSSHLHLIIAATLILKHATLLRLSNTPKWALINAELNYQKANIDVAIQQHLKAHASEYSSEQFACFIMNTDIVHQPTQSG